MDWFTTGKGGCQSCVLSSYLFNLYAEYIMRNARLDEAQAGIKSARRIINIYWIIEKVGECQLNICFRFIDYAKPFDCMDHKKLWEIWKTQQ